MSEPHIDVLPVAGDVTRTAAGLAALPAELTARWNQHGEAQLATLYTARDGDRLVAAAFEVHRPLTAYRKVVDVWLADEDGAAQARTEAALLDAVEARAWREGAVAVKREFRERGGAGSPWARSLARCYTELAAPEWGGPVAGPHRGGQVHGQVLWRGAAPDREVPYMRQTTDFTCGPVALQMGLAAVALAGAPSRDEELALWRQATTVGGCEPLGLALAAADRGARPTVSLSTEQPVLLELCTDDEERDLRGFIQSGFRAQAAARGLEVRTEPFTLDAVRDAVAAGGVALVLIEQQGMHQESCPHWITVYGVQETPGGEPVFLAHDPWTDAHLGESWVDAAALPLPSAALDRLAWYGTPSYRGMVRLERG